MASFSFPRAARLLKHVAFDRAYREGRRIYSAHFTAFFRQRGAAEAAAGGAPGARVGFTVGRVLGGAVARNRIRRRMREAVRYHLALLEAPVDVVMHPRKAVLDAAFAQLSAEVARAFEKIRSQ